LVAIEILSQKESDTEMQDACDGNIDGGDHFMTNKTQKEVVDVRKCNFLECIHTGNPTPWAN
jgi:hypothetical protein